MPCTPGCLAIVKNVEMVHPTWRNRFVRVNRQVKSDEVKLHESQTFSTAWWISADDGSTMIQPRIARFQLGVSGMFIERYVESHEKEVYCLDEFLIPITPPGVLDETPAPPVATPIRVPELMK